MAAGSSEPCGVLLLDKPPGYSSTQALGRAKRMLAASKAGHTGTLDPFATGLLPIAFGEATKFSRFLIEAPKSYLATLVLGEVTPTGDTEGEVTERREPERDTARIDLRRRARRLAARYDLPVPRSIRWAPNQLTLWGSCTPDDGTIRVSSRLGAYPRWVLDYVIVHELAHLVVRTHGPRFARLVDRYPMAERARGFLIAKGIDPEDSAVR